MNDTPLSRLPLTADLPDPVILQAIVEDDLHALGAALRISQVVGPAKAIDAFLKLAEMNIRGRQFAFAYEALSMARPKWLLSRIQHRSQELVDAVNLKFQNDATMPHKAIVPRAPALDIIEKKKLTAPKSLRMVQGLLPLEFKSKVSPSEQPRKKMPAKTVFAKVAPLMSEGNDNARKTIKEFANAVGPEIATHYLLDLADMNIRGPQLAYAFKVICEGNPETLMALAHRRDPNMIQTLNFHFISMAEKMPYKAVQRGALNAEKFPTFNLRPAAKNGSPIVGL